MIVVECSLLLFVVMLAIWEVNSSFAALEWEAVFCLIVPSNWIWSLMAIKC
ncbi:hypothetical protein [[Mycoplasma] collis]|uniref:hypothetical protein n=1 Tax=[Mycoplasma] collis TaxID=2127 RepID=UPI0012EB973C|nr:hypothetical protein [[Mycoplasma] collis]